MSESVTTHHYLSDIGDRTLMLNGKMASWAVSSMKSISNLSEVEFQVFSQWGEDGIIDWLVTHFPIYSESFIELGVEDFRESNCRFLMQNRNWKGLVFDGNEENIDSLKKQPYAWMYNLLPKADFIDKDNINTLISTNGFNGNIGILSIDIDGNDYWVWNAIDVVNPDIIICEYNAVLGDMEPIAVPYNPTFSRYQAHYCGSYFGCSIAALKFLARKKGYVFVGTNSNGINAFFVRKDLTTDLDQLIVEPKAFPSRIRGGRNKDGTMAFLAPLDRVTKMLDAPIVNVESGEICKISDIKELYSLNWRTAMS